MARTTTPTLWLCRLLVVLTGSALAREVSGQEWQASATRVPAPPTIDGVLDEAFWGMIEPITGFRQRDPVDGAPATERTEVRIAYDENAIYFGMMMYDSEPHLILRNILQRGGWIDKDDRVIIALDTYHDGRNAYEFEIGALGEIHPAQERDRVLASHRSGVQGRHQPGLSVRDAHGPEKPPQGSPHRGEAVCDRRDDAARGSRRMGRRGISGST